MAGNANGYHILGSIMGQMATNYRKKDHIGKIISNEIKRTPRITTNEKACESQVRWTTIRYLGMHSSGLQKQDSWQFMQYVLSISRLIDLNPILEAIGLPDDPNCRLVDISISASPILRQNS